MILLVSYDLHDERNYDAIQRALRTYDSFHVQESVWLLDTEDKATDVRAKVKAAGDGDDSILVVRLRGTWAATHSPGLKDWIETRSF